MSETGGNKTVKGKTATRRTGNVAGMLRESEKLRVTLGVRLTAAEAPDLQAALKREIADGAKELVFDLKDTATMDSTGIGLLVAAGNSLLAAQGGIRLVNVKDDIFKLLRSMRLTERLRASAQEEKVSHG